MLRRLRFLATCGPVGFWTTFPGTVASILAIVVIFFIFQVNISDLLWVGCVIFLGFISTREYLKQSTHQDPSEVVIDEVAGMMVAMLFVPKTSFFLASSFVLFRLFDILKPYPIRRFEKLPSEWGVMMDDVVAGLMANVVLQIIRFVL